MKQIIHTKSWLDTHSIGSALIFAGISYGLVQFIHPLDTVANTSSTQWVVVHILSLAMDVAAIIGLLGLRSMLKKRIGRIGGVGISLYIIFWFLIFGFHFAEAFIIPLLANSLPEFVATWQGLITGETGRYNLGAIPVVYGIAGLLYILGGFTTGIAVVKSFAKVPGVILAAGSLLTLLGAVIPHPADRIMAIPIAIAFVWIGIIVVNPKKPHSLL